MLELPTNSTAFSGFEFLLSQSSKVRIAFSQRLASGCGAFLS
jgi:hypothetical protein